MPCASLSKLIEKNIVHTSIDNYSIDQEIFKSISRDYIGFEEWFIGIQKEKRKCFAIEGEQNELEAIMIYKKEEINELHTLFPYVSEIKEIIKICTFKVHKTKFGKKIGELFIQKIIYIALFKNIKGIYLTAYPKHEYLIFLLKKFGFKEKLVIDNEIYLYKDLNISFTENIPLFAYQKNLIESFPFFNDSYKEINKFIIPIRPHYHDIIFYDYPLREYSLFDRPTSINSESNSILKAYFGNFSRNIQIGDIILFYRSQDLMQLTTLCVVVQVFNKEYKGIFHELSKYRTVFSRDELSKYIESKNSTLIIFIPIFYLSNKITYDTLTKLSMASNKLQTINQITDEQYRSIIEKEDCYKCFNRRT